MVPEMSADEIMNVAEAKYKIMVGKGTWNAVTKKEESFIALQAAYDTMLKKHSAPRKGDGRVLSQSASSSTTYSKGYFATYWTLSYHSQCTPGYCSTGTRGGMICRNRIPSMSPSPNGKSVPCSLNWHRHDCSATQVHWQSALFSTPSCILGGPLPGSAGKGNSGTPRTIGRAATSSGNVHAQTMVGIIRPTEAIPIQPIDHDPWRTMAQ